MVCNAIKIYFSDEEFDMEYVSIPDKKESYVTVYTHNGDEIGTYKDIHDLSETIGNRRAISVWYYLTGIKLINK